MHTPAETMREGLLARSLVCCAVCLHAARLGGALVDSCGEGEFTVGRDTVGGEERGGGNEDKCIRVREARTASYSSVRCAVHACGVKRSADGAILRRRGNRLISSRFEQLQHHP